MNHALIFSSRANSWERSSGAHRVATHLRNNGMDVEVVDFTPFWELELLKEFTRKSVTPKTLFFGFSIFFSFWNQTMTDFTAWLKITYPHIKTIAGGQHLLQSRLSHIDIWVDSYGEEAVLALAKSLAGNTLSGIKFSAEFFGDRKVIKALQSYPSYDLGDYSILMERRDFLESWEWLTVEFSRGCKFSCAFCNFPILGLKEDTSRNVFSFEREMKYNYENFGINRYFVADETFNDRVEKITKFANVVERLEFKPFFSGFIRADLLSKPDMISELARMNFGGQYYGVETFNHNSGKVVGKGLDPEKVKQLLLDSKQFFKANDLLYRGTVSLIVGLPFDSPEDWRLNKIWLTDNWMDQGLVVFPLVIEDLQNNNIQDYTKLSKFSQNLTKYGIRSMGSQDIQRHTDPHGNHNWKSGGWAKTENLWEHDTMNIFEAEQIANEFQLSSVNDFAIDSWCLSWPEKFEKRKIDNLSLHINKSKSQLFTHMHHMNDFIKQYSLKKIN